MHARRYLTKSRFKLATECPTKLFYVGKPDYVDRSVDDTFLATLAEGGYQVGALACLIHPGGVRVDELDHASALARTAELLDLPNVTIFEAALAFEGLFVRVDILVKRGGEVDLIEVKAKSYAAAKDGDFRGARGALRADFLPYLRDVAFQRYVAERALPNVRVRTFLMLADKQQRASVDGLNQRFRARKVDGRLQVAIAPGTDASSLGAPLLAAIPVDGQVDEILAGALDLGSAGLMAFGDAVGYLAQAYAADRRVPPKPSSACGGCQFRSERWPAQGEPKSGFHECWGEAFGWAPDDFAGGTILDLWHLRDKDELIGIRVLKPSQVQLADLRFDGEPPGAEGLSRKHRQWYACRPGWPGGGEFYFDGDGMRRAMAAWTFPLHFIDFETCAVALPFVRGRRPYETTAFQFSHHVMGVDGAVVHRTQWICADPGVDPNLGFLRALKAALDADQGTIFRWAAHENTVLNQLRAQLVASDPPPADRDELITFIDQVTTRPQPGGGRQAGPRNMVDLCDLAEKLYFHPSTKGSTSLKKVLPALMRSSSFLRDHYSRAWYGGASISLNFVEPIAWWQERDGEVVDPYLLLPPVFDDVTRQEIEALDEGLAPELREGGAAMAAYARLQFEDLPSTRRDAIVAALLRYCELDTLAMVMAVQAWRAWAYA